MFEEYVGNGAIYVHKSWDEQDEDEQDEPVKPMSMARLMGILPVG